MSKTWTYSGDAGYSLRDAILYALKAAPKSYLEIGVDGGMSLEPLLMFHRPERIVLSDIWNPEYCQHGHNSHAHIAAMLSRLGVDLRDVTFLDGDSKVTIPTLKETFDLITVDGDHSAEGALVDLQNTWPLLNEGGLLLFDDTNHPEYPWLHPTMVNWMKSVSPTPEVIQETTGLATTTILKKKRPAA